MSVKVNFEKHCNEANSWLLEIAENIDHPGRTDWAYGCLKAVLHTIRDRTTIEEVFHFSAQLPVLIRGIFFEGYKPTGKPDKMNANEFIRKIKKEVGPGGFGYPEEAFRVVLELLYKKHPPVKWMTFEAQCRKEYKKYGINIAHCNLIMKWKCRPRLLQ